MASAAQAEPRSRRRLRKRPSRSTLIRWIVVAVVGAWVAWLVISVGLANAFGSSRPDAMVRLRGNDSSIQTRLADRALLRPPPAKPDVTTARQLAIAALSRDPLQVGAWRDLALIASAAGDGRRFRLLLRAAEGVSRRDVPTQIAMIEDAVARGQVVEALGHYDKALRVSLDSDGALLPVLAGATASGDVRPSLAKLLRNSPSWRRRFLVTLNGGAGTPEGYAALLDELARTGPVPDRDLIAVSARRYALEGRFDPAWRLYRHARGRSGPEAPLRNPGFDLSGPIEPFEWLLEQNGGVDARVVARAGGNGLEIVSERGDVGPAARQLLRLAPGRYDLRFTAEPLAAIAPATLYWRVSCATGGGAPLLDRSATAARAAWLGGRVSVPNGCGTQWLELGFLPGTSDTEIGASVSAFSLRPTVGA